MIFYQEFFKNRKFYTFSIIKTSQEKEVKKPGRRTDSALLSLMLHNLSDILNILNFPVKVKNTGSLSDRKWPIFLIYA